MTRQRYCPRLTRYRNTQRFLLTGRQASCPNRAESRVLDLQKRLREKNRLSAGGRWISNHLNRIRNKPFWLPPFGPRNSPSATKTGSFLPGTDGSNPPSFSAEFRNGTVRLPAIIPAPVSGALQQQLVRDPGELPPRPDISCGTAARNPRHQQWHGDEAGPPAGFRPCFCRRPMPSCFGCLRENSRSAPAGNG